MRISWGIAQEFYFLKIHMQVIDMHPELRTTISSASSSLVFSDPTPMCSVTTPSISVAFTVAFFFFPPIFLGLCLRHMEVPRLGGLNRSCSCWPMPQPWQRQIFNPLSEARDQTRVLMDTSRIHYH